MIKFIRGGYWDTSTMKQADSPTEEQLAQVDKVCEELNRKYSNEQGCLRHPDSEQGITVTFSNKFIDFQVWTKYSCECEAILGRLAEIRDAEMVNYNPERFKKVQDQS